jgi:hypothetical protein
VTYDDDGQRLEETAEEYVARVLHQRESADRDRMAALQGHDTRNGMPNKRCIDHNVLMEPVGVIGPHMGFYCQPCDAIQLRPHVPA